MYWRVPSRCYLWRRKVFYQSWWVHRMWYLCFCFVLTRQFLFLSKFSFHTLRFRRGSFKNYAFLCCSVNIKNRQIQKIRLFLFMFCIFYLFAIGSSCLACALFGSAARAFQNFLWQQLCCHLINVIADVCVSPTEAYLLSVTEESVLLPISSTSFF